MAALLAAAAALAAQAADWAPVGRQGLVQIVIVPASEAADRGAYDRALARLCEPERTCFVNFHTNSTGAAAELPLPDAIAAEATARYRRSTKNGVERFQWSCRMKIADADCF